MAGRRPSRIEPEFAQWMRSHLGYQASDTNVPLLIGSGAPARFVAVRGETYGAAWRHLRSAAFIVFAAAIVHRSVVAVPEGEIPIVPTVLSTSRSPPTWPRTSDGCERASTLGCNARRRRRPCRVRTLSR